MDYKIIRISERPELKEQAAQWFHEKWQIPMEAYEESMEQCMTKKEAVPQWYVAVEDERIIGGMGVIENDFHDRKDLSPNVCAVYVEEDHRCRGIAGVLLNFVCHFLRKSITFYYLQLTFVPRYSLKSFLH